jgi:tRNA/tmRNA/rRNA uracil-C5-methylase (TrmA/RlmC/RlmD family)
MKIKEIEKNYTCLDLKNIENLNNKFNNQLNQIENILNKIFNNISKELKKSGKISTLNSEEGKLITSFCKLTFYLQIVWHFYDIT